MTDHDPPSIFDGGHRTDVDPDLLAFDEAMKATASGTGRNDATVRELHTFKTSVYFSIDNLADGSVKVRDTFAKWLSQLSASPVLKGTPISVRTVDTNVALTVASLPTGGAEFQKLVGWQRSNNDGRTYKNVFLCVNISTHTKFSVLKYSILKFLQESKIHMDRNHSLSDKVVEMVNLGYLSAYHPDWSLQDGEEEINSVTSRVAARKYKKEELIKFGFLQPERSWQ
eukprot:scaffold4366_cov99-Cylindrotheca_fusiformis.AAC.1